MAIPKLVWKSLALWTQELLLENTVELPLLNKRGHVRKTAVTALRWQRVRGHLTWLNAPWCKPLFCCLTFAWINTTQMVS